MLSASKIHSAASLPIAAALITFAVGVVSPSMTDIGIGHGGVLQILTGYLQGYLQGVRAGSRVDMHVLLSLEQLQLHAYSFLQPMGVG